jgi:hypothetical protein
MASHAITVHLVAGTPQPTWCDGCMTSARVTVPIYALRPGGVTHISTWTGCPTCCKGARRA